MGRWKTRYKVRFGYFRQNVCPVAKEVADGVAKSTQYIQRMKNVAIDLEMSSNYPPALVGRLSNGPDPIIVICHFPGAFLLSISLIM
jgi:hypothetical protein